MLKWPDHSTVHPAVCSRARHLGRCHPAVLRIGYIGSYARGDWGVGSDLDLILILEQDDPSLERRMLQGAVADLPVPVDLLVYTRAEWQNLAAQKGRFYETVEREAVWVYEREPH